MYVDMREDFTWVQVLEGFRNLGVLLNSREYGGYMCMCRACRGQVVKALEGVDFGDQDFLLGFGALWFGKP